MEKKSICPWVVAALILIMFMFVYFNGGDMVEKQYAVLNQLCDNLSEHYPSRNFYEQCRLEMQVVYDKNNPSPQLDDYDPYEDAQPGAYSD